MSAGRKVCYPPRRGDAPYSGSALRESPKKADNATKSTRHEIVKPKAHDALASAAIVFCLIVPVRRDKHIRRGHYCHGSTTDRASCPASRKQKANASSVVVVVTGQTSAHVWTKHNTRSKRPQKQKTMTKTVQQITTPLSLPLSLSQNSRPKIASTPSPLARPPRGCSAAPLLSRCFYSRFRCLASPTPPLILCFGPLGRWSACTTPSPSCTPALRQRPAPILAPPWRPPGPPRRQTPPRRSPRSS